MYWVTFVNVEDIFTKQKQKQLLLKHSVYSMVPLSTHVSSLFANIA